MGLPHVVDNIQLHALLDLSQTELDVVATALSHPSVKRYLNNYMLHGIIDHANTPLPQLATEPLAYAVKQAFIKGHIGCIQDLLNIEKAPTKAPKPPVE